MKKWLNIPKHFITLAYWSTINRALHRNSVRPSRARFTLPPFLHSSFLTHLTFLLLLLLLCICISSQHNPTMGFQKIKVANPIVEMDGLSLPPFFDLICSDPIIPSFSQFHRSLLFISFSFHLHFFSSFRVLLSYCRVDVLPLLCFDWIFFLF